MGAPTWPPSPQTFGAPRRSRDAPLSGLVLERDVHARPVERHLALVDGHVEAGDLGDAQVTQRLAGGRHRVLDGVLPRHLAGSDEIGHAVDAVAGHDGPPRRSGVTSTLQRLARNSRSTRLKISG